MEYQLVRKRGLKRLTLRMTSKGPRVYAPKWVPKILVDSFVEKHKSKLSKISIQDGDHYALYREQARSIVTPCVFVWSQTMELEYNTIRIKNTRSRWGSCSSKGNVNFSYKVAFLPDHLRDYIIVHELAHLVHMNHSAAFWSLVSRYIPNYMICRQELDLYAKNQKQIEFPK